jgi:hypothetical protein
MTDAGVSTGMGWWPKLVLWGTVIAAGSGYLLSVEQHRRDAAPQTAGQAALTPPVANRPVTTAPEPVPPMVSPPAPGAASAVEAPAAPTGLPGRAAEPSAQRPVSAATTPTAESRTESPAPERGAAEPARPRTAASAPATPVPPPAVPQPARASEVTPVEARAFAEAVTEGAPAKPAPPASAPGSAPGTVPQRTVGALPDHTQSPAEAERARILAEYEALRRAAEGDLQPPGGLARPGPWGHRPTGRPQGFYGPAPYGAAGSDRGYPPTYPGW